MVDRKAALPVTRQCALLDLPRSTFYHVPKRVSDEELELMALIDRCHLKHPFYGSRRIRDWLEDRGHRVNRKKVRRLMRTMDLTAQYPKRNLSLANQAHKVYPYLLRDLVIDRPNQVWATDVTYIPMATGFVYLVAIMDWATRRVLSWRLSNTMHADFCVDALNEAIDQGVTLIDTADVYGHGHSEDLISGIIKERGKKDLIIATKAGNDFYNATKADDHGFGPIIQTYTKDYIIFAAEPSSGQMAAAKAAPCGSGRVTIRIGVIAPPLFAYPRSVTCTGQRRNRNTHDPEPDDPWH